MTTAGRTGSDARAAVLAAVQALFTNEVISRSGHANLSARSGDDSMLLTTTGIVRSLRPDDLALVRLDGTVTEGRLAPENAEIVTMHSEVYKTRPDVGGIIHTHAPNLLAFAMANRPLPCRYEALLRFGQAEDVPVVPWAPRGSKRSVGGIIDTLSTQPGTQAVLLGNHGVLVFGPGPAEAVALLTVLDEAAEGELAALPLGGAASFPPGALADVRASMARARS